MTTYEILYFIFQGILWLLNIYSIGLVIYFFMSWIPGLREGAIGQFMGRIYEPYLEIFRNFIPPISMIDISSIFALIVLRFFNTGLEAIFNIILRNVI